MRSARCIAAIAAFAVAAAAFGQPAGVDRGKLESLHEAGAAFAKALADANATIEAVADSRQKLEHEVARFQTNPSPEEKRIVDLYAAAATGYQDARNRFLTEKSREHFLADVKQVQAQLAEADRLYQSSPAAAPAPAPPIAPPLPAPPPSQPPPEQTVPVQPEPMAPPVPVPPPMPPAHSPEPPTHARPPIPPPPAPPPVIPVPPPTTTAVPPPQPGPEAAPPPPATANPPVPVPQPPPMEAPPPPTPPAVVPAPPPALPPPAPVSPPAAAAAPTPSVPPETPPAAASPAPPPPPILVPEPPSVAPAPEPAPPPSAIAEPPPAAHRPPPTVARGELPTTPNDVRKAANKLRIETNAASVVDRCTLLGEVTTGEVRSGVYEIGGHNFLYDDALGLARLKTAEVGGNTLLVRNRTKTSVTGDAYRCGP